MKLTDVKTRLLLAGAVLAGLFLGLSPMVHADTYPFLTATGGDVWAGGWFNTGSACDLTNYQDNANGGVNTYLGASGGSSGDFGAYVLGKIDTSGSGPSGGFKTDAVGAGSNKLSFANNASPSGLFQGSTRQQHCVPDYYGTKKNTSTGWDGNYADNGQYVVAPNSTLSGGTVSSSLTLFVNGNVFIAGDIRDAAGYTEANVPKFALVVKGNIFIDPAVHQLDGLYIAQPSSGTNDGVIWTCHDNTAGQSLLGSWIHDNCASSLTVNGSLIAKQINYLRTNGDVSAAGSPAAEVINYTAANVVGGPFFNPSPPTSLKVESLVSLPPLY